MVIKDNKLTITHEPLIVSMSNCANKLDNFKRGIVAT